MSNEELKKILDNFDKHFNKKEEDEQSIRNETRFNKLKLDMERHKRIIHESDKQIGEVVRRLKIKISRENLFMDDVTREELK